MIAIYAAVAALALAWFAGDAVLAMCSATLFGHAREQGVGTAFAGLVFGDLLGQWVFYAGICCVTPMAVLLGVAAGRRLKQRGWKAAVVPLLGIAVLVSAHGLTGATVNHGLRTAQELRENPDATRMEEFRGAFHQRSRRIFTLEMLSALALAIGAVLAAHRHNRRLSLGSATRGSAGAAPLQAR